MKWETFALFLFRKWYITSFMVQWKWALNGFKLNSLILCSVSFISLSGLYTCIKDDLRILKGKKVKKCVSKTPVSEKRDLNPFSVWLLWLLVRYKWKFLISNIFYWRTRVGESKDSKNTKLLNTARQVRNHRTVVGVGHRNLINYKHFL